MPSVDVSSIISNLNPIRQTSSYTMPVLSPRHASSTSYAGSYRSTFSSTSDRPYYNTYGTRFNYDRYTTSRSYVSDDTKKSYSRHSSITEDTLPTKYLDGDSSISRRDSLTRDSSSRGSSLRDGSLSRLDMNSRSTSSVLDDLRNKYSPANYVPMINRKSMSDIGRPPLETTRRTRKVTDLSNSNNGVINSTNSNDNASGFDDNGNSRVSVAEIRKKFDKCATAPLSVQGLGLRLRPNLTNGCALNGESTKTNGGSNNRFYNTRTTEETNDNVTDETEQDSSSETPKSHNHTSDFASYISSKELDRPEEKPDEDNTSDCAGRANENDDISTSPRVSRAASTAATLAQTPQNSSSASLSPVSQRSSTVERTRDEERSPASPVKNQGLNGLKNIGNTCFMNSVVQCLSNTRLLLEYVRNDAYMEDINTSISSMKGALIKAFSQVIQELWSTSGNERVVNTVALKSQIQRFAPRFMGYAQQDAQEFLRYLLEGLHEDVNRVTVKALPILTEIDDKLSDVQKAAESWQRYLRMDNSRVVDIFVGQLKSTLRCTHCGHCSVTFDPFWDLSLPIPQRQGTLRLAQCLEHFTREETLDGDEKPTCSKCKERRKCTKSFSIQKFPKILVIHLKRFSPTERFRGKLGVLIDFPLMGLDMSAHSASKAHTDCLYNLYAVSNHSGTTYSGHYTAYCKHPYSAQWHEYNDSRVSSVSQKSVVSSEAYVLFYELVGSHPHL